MLSFKCVNDVYCRGKIKILKHVFENGVAFGQQILVLYAYSVKRLKNPLQSGWTEAGSVLNNFLYICSTM